MQFLPLLPSCLALVNAISCIISFWVCCLTFPLIVHCMNEKEELHFSKPTLQNVIICNKTDPGDVIF